MITNLSSVSLVAKESKVPWQWQNPSRTTPSSNYLKSKNDELTAQQLCITNSFMPRLILFTSRTLRQPYVPISIDKIKRRTSFESFRVWSQFQFSYKSRSSLFWLYVFHLLSSNAIGSVPFYLISLSWYGCEIINSISQSSPFHSSPLV